MPRLIARSPEFTGQEFDLTAPLISIGRVEGNDIVLTHPSVSSKHAELRLEGGDYRLVDHNSTNGTKVNDERISEVMLRNQDLVSVGNIVLAYVSSNALAAAPLPEASGRVEIGGSTRGRPAAFTNLAPFAKPKPKSGAVPVLIWVAAFVALAGLGFLGYKLFLG